MRSRLVAAVSLALLALAVLWFVLAADPSAARSQASSGEPRLLEPAADELHAPPVEVANEAREVLATGRTDEAQPELVPEEESAQDETRFWGRLVDRETGYGIADAWVEFHGRTGIGPAGRGVVGEGERVRSDPEGHFELTAPAEGGQVMECEPAGYGRIVFKLTEGHATRATAQVLALVRAASWSVVVQDAEDGPLAGVELELFAPTYSLARPEGHFVSGRSRGVEFSGITDGSGRAEFTQLPAEVPLKLEATWNGRTLPQPDALVLEPGEVRADVLRLFGRATLRVRVVDQLGVSLAGRDLWLLRDQRGGAAPDERMAFSSSNQGDVVQETRSDGEGLATFEQLTSGDWWVGIAPAGRDSRRASRLLAALLEGTPSKELERAVVPLARPFRVTPETGELELELVAHRGAFITGEVSGIEEDRQRTRVRAKTDAYRAFLWTEVDAQGRFVLGPLMEGSYELSASERLGGLHAPGVLAHAGDRDVRLELQQGGAFSGRIVDAATGEPAAGGLVVWSPPPRFHLSLGFANDGREEFSSTGLAPSTYDLTARTPDGRVGTLRGVEVRPGSSREDLVVRVQPGGRLRIRYFGPSTYANYHVYDGTTVVAANGLHRGTSELETVPAAKLRVELDAHAAGTHERVLFVRPGESAEVVFDLR